MRLNVARPRKIRAVIGLATRGRQKMLQAALQSIQALQVPDGVSVRVVVVENDAVEASRKVVETTIKDHELIYALEPEIGIASARNRVVELAKQVGADVLLFFDDDEMVAPDWLERMIAAWLSGQGLLIGGPVRIHFDWTPQSRYRAFMQRAIMHHYSKRERTTARIFAKGGSDLVSTNNCLIDMSLFTVYGLSYSTQYHSGSDKRFYQDVYALGLKTGWVPEAAVNDSWPRDRTSLRYNFFRASEQEKTWFAACEPKKRLAYALRRMARCVGYGLLLTAGLLPSRGYTIIAATRMAGRVWGLLAAALGSRSNLYKVPTGQ